MAGIKGDAQSITQKWVRNISQATPDITAGIARVTQAPGQAAAKQAAVWAANTAAAQKKWTDNVGAVSLNDWQQAATAGVARIASGAQQKQGKMEKHLTNFLPVLARNVAQVQSMPSGSLEANIARMIQMARLNSQYKKPAN